MKNSFYSGSNFPIKQTNLLFPNLFENSGFHCIHVHTTVFIKLYIHDVHVPLPWLRWKWLSWSCCWNSWSSCFFTRIKVSCNWLLSATFSSSSSRIWLFSDSISLVFSANISSSLDKSSLYWNKQQLILAKGITNNVQFTENGKRQFVNVTKFFLYLRLPYMDYMY